VRRALAAASLAFAGVVGLALLLRLLPHAIATGDAAATEIFVLHATRGPWPLGPYSQFYWNHPGPLMFYLLAPVYALSGQHAQALNVGAALLNLAAAGMLLRIAARAAEPVATVAISLALAAWLVRAPETLSSFWNPVLIALPAALFVWLCSAATTGGAMSMVAVVGVGSLLAQSHVGLVPPVALSFVAATAAGWHRASRAGSDARRSWRLGLASAIVFGLALWALPLNEQLTGEPGNLTLIARFFAGAPRGTRSLGESATLWADALTQVARPGFHQPIGVPLSVATHPWLVAAGGGLLALLGAMAWRTRGRPGLASAASFHALIALIGLAAIHRVPGLVGDYTIFWLAPVGASAIALVAAWAFAALVGRVVRDTTALATFAKRWLPRVVLLIAVGSTALDLRGHLSGAGSPQRFDALSGQIRAGLEARGIRDPLVFIDNDAWAEAAAALLQLYKRQEPFAVDPAWRFMYGQPLTAARCHTHAMRFGLGEGSGDVIARSGSASVNVERRTTCPPY